MKTLIAFLCCIMFTAPASAKTEFFATIPVDVEAEDSVQAKDKAMLEAERKAFLEVAGKLTSAENVQKLSELNDDSLSYFIKSVSVDNEKAGGTKYKADLTVQINEPLLRDYMVENEMLQAETTDLTVIPVYKPLQSYPLLWEDNNEWRKNWLSKGLIKFGSMQIRTASEQMRHVDGLSADGALYMDSALFEQVSQAGHTDRVYIVYAQLEPNGDLRITVKNVKAGTEDVFTVYNDNTGNLFDKAIEKSVMYISNMERNTKTDTGTAATDSINAVYIYQNMKDWLDKNALITNLPMVENIDTKSFGGGKVNFSIRYTGSLDDLWTALQELGISHEHVENYYILR